MALNSRQRRKAEAKAHNEFRASGHKENAYRTCFILGRPPARDLRFPEGLRLRKENLKGKGMRGRVCNVNACQTPNSAFYYNRGTKAYYCYFCARDIYQASLRHADVDGRKLFVGSCGRLPPELTISREEYNERAVDGVYIHPPRATMY